MVTPLTEMGNQEEEVLQEGTDAYKEDFINICEQIIKGKCLLRCVSVSSRTLFMACQNWEYLLSKGKTTFKLISYFNKIETAHQQETEAGYTVPLALYSQSNAGPRNNQALSILCLPSA